MRRLPDLEAMAIFAKVAELRAFSAAAQELQLSKATVSKAVSRLEQRLGARLIIRTARHFELTELGRQLVARATHILSEGEAAEEAGKSASTAPRGIVRLAAPLSFGTLHVAPLLPSFFEAYPEITVDLHLSDGATDLIAEGFDAGIRIAMEPGAALSSQLICPMPRHLVAAPRYLNSYGRPTHPSQLSQHRCIAYSLARQTDLWRFTKGSKSTSVRPAGPLRVNNGDAMLPALLAGTGIGILPEFFLRFAFSSGQLERVLPEWSTPLGAVYWVAPPEGPPPQRVSLLRDFLVERLAERGYGEPLRAMTRRGATR